MGTIEALTIELKRALPRVEILLVGIHGRRRQDAQLAWDATSVGLLECVRCRIAARCVWKF
jgi:hypothetical protein